MQETAALLFIALIAVRALGECNVGMLGSIHHTVLNLHPFISPIVCNIP